MIKGTTSTGFKFNIFDEILDDMELIELISEADDNPLKVPKLLTKLLGEKQKNRLYDHCRNERGIVKIESIGNELVNIFNTTSKIKK